MNSLFKETLLSNNDEFIAEIKTLSREEQEARLNVYRNNVFVSLIDALADIFPVTKMLVGEDFFQAMAREFIKNNPPKNPVISEYGETFPAFLKSFKPVENLPFLMDLAEVERCLLLITNSEEFPPLEHDEISATFEQTSDPSMLYLTLAPNCRLFTSPYAIGSLYKAHQTDSTIAVSDISISQSEHLLIAKDGLFAKLYEISEDESLFFDRLMQQQTLGNAIPNSDNFDVSVALAKLIQWKLIIHISEAANDK